MNKSSSGNCPVATDVVNVTETVVSAPACAPSERNLSMKTLSLGDLRVVTASVRVATMGNVILLGVATQEVPVADGHGGFTIKHNKVPVVPSNSIFGKGEYVRVQYGKCWFTVKSIDIEKCQLELVRQFDTTGGQVRFKDFYAVRGVDSHILNICRYGKNAVPATVAKTARIRATQFLDKNVINPGTDGVCVWTPWASTWNHDYDQIGLGVRAARKFWSLVLDACTREGVEVSEHVSKIVFEKPWLLNDSGIYVNRQPTHDSENLAILRIVVTNSPFAAPTVTPELMKAMAADEDGDACSKFTGRRAATCTHIIGQVMSNLANRLDVGPLTTFGIGYKSGNTSGVKGNKAIDVSLQNVTYTTGNLWNDFQGFKTKGIIGMLCTSVWQYSWAFSRLLSTDELVAFGTESISRDTVELVTASKADAKRLNRRIEKMNTMLKGIAINAKSERVAQLAGELTYRVFRDMFEHVFDARKGDVLAYDPLENLKALSSTGRFDWVGMEAAGLWTSPLKLVSTRIWQTAISMNGNEYPKYSLRQVIAQYDVEFYHFVADRSNGWKNDQQGVQALMTSFIETGLDGLVSSLYLQRGFIPRNVIDVPVKYNTPQEKGELYNLLEDARPGRKFNVGPSNMAEALSYLRQCGIEVEVTKDAQGTMFLSMGNIKQMLPSMKVIPNNMTISGTAPEYPGHVIHTGTTVRACPPVLVHTALNPFATMADKLEQKNRKDKFPGLDHSGFTLLNFYGVFAHTILGAAQEGLTPVQFVRRAVARITAFVNQLELVRNDAAESVFGDMVRVELRKSGISSDWFSLSEDYTAKALFEAGYSLYAVSKNNPMAKFVKVNKDLGVPSIVAAYDVFWPLRTARRYDREALAVSRQMRRFSSPSINTVKSTHGLEGVFAPHKQMVTMAFFNSPDNDGGHDPVDFTPSGMLKSASDDITWVWMSLEEKNRFFAQLEDEDLKKVYSLIRNLKASGREIVKDEQIDEELLVPKFCIPVEWGVEDMGGVTFKGNFAGTKSQVKPMGRQLIASYTPIKSYNTLDARLASTGKSQVILIDGVMPADTVVAKGAWSLIAQAAASRLNEGFVLDTHNPEEIVTRVIPSISQALEAEGKPSDGKMYIYRLGDDCIEPVTGPDGKVLRAVVGEVPMYRIPFEADFSGGMTKFRRGQGLEKLGHIERVLINEVPVISPADRVEFALAMHDLKQALENLPTSTVEFEDDFFEEEFID